jgi:uncharacterized membrane protein YfcA
MNQKKDNNNSAGNYAKYSALAFQMGIIIFIFVWAGMKIDEKFMDDKRVFVIVFSLLGVFIALYFALKDFINFKNKK